MDIVGLIKSLADLLNKLLAMFAKTEAEKEQKVRDDVAKESDSVKNGGLPE